MTDRAVVVIGLPASGKTTFLAALWHLMTARDKPTELRFGELSAGNIAHLRAIASRWREAKIQDRTAINGTRLVSMNLLDHNDLPVQITFPDVPGEAYRRMWEERECDPEVADLMKSGGILLFVHADTIQAPRWVLEQVGMAQAMGIEIEQDELVTWDPRLAPTQVQLVDLLQLLRMPPLDSGPRRLGIMLSAWDKAEGDGLSPEEYLRQKLPLLWQYLKSGADGWDFCVHGVSAQGGDYDPIEEDAPRHPEAAELRKLQDPSSRIRLVSSTSETHDLTVPLVWLMEKP